MEGDVVAIPLHRQLAASSSTCITYQVTPFKGTLHRSLDTVRLLVVMQSKLQNRPDVHCNNTCGKAQSQ